MKFKKSIVISLILIGIGAGLFYLLDSSQHQKRPTVAVLQWASHPALDAARNGFISEFQALCPDMDIEVQTAEGSLVQARALAVKFHASKNIRAIFTVATPATQAMAAVESEKPIVFAAVTDPIKMGYWEERSNLAGIQDRIDPEKLARLAKSLLPSARRAALLYNPAEVNSVSLAASLDDALQSLGFAVVHIGAGNESEMPIAAASAARKGDFIITPTDNTVASTIELIASQASRYGKPLIVSDNLLVPHGALASRGVNYEESGRKAANLLAEILKNGTVPRSLPLGQPALDKVVMNSDKLAELSLALPPVADAHLEVICNE